MPRVITVPRTFPPISIKQMAHLPWSLILVETPIMISTVEGLEFHQDIERGLEKEAYSN